MSRDLDTNLGSAQPENRPVYICFIWLCCVQIPCTILSLVVCLHYVTLGLN